MFLRDADNMGMMGEYDRLDRAARLFKRPQSGRYAGIVETGEKIVANERRRLRAPCVIFQKGQAQGEIKLVAGAFAQVGHAQFGAVKALCPQMQLVVVAEILLEFAVSSLGEAGKKLAGAENQ